MSPRQRPRATRRFMVRDTVLSPWGDTGTVTQVHPTILFVKWRRELEPEPIDRALVRLRHVGRPRGRVRT